jgi:predicted MFS family arabinose efflux permease
LPLGLLNLILAWRFLPQDLAKTQRPTFDLVGTALLALTLAAYALAMTLGHMIAWLSIAAMAAALFILAEARVAAPLISLSMLRHPGLAASLVMSVLVTSVMMATLVVGPFYLARALGLGAASVGLVMSCGPLISALAGMPSGRIVDRFGAGRMITIGLVAAAIGTLGLALIPARLGIAGYVAPIAVITIGYALFQAANNTRIMSDIAADQRGIVSGLLSLSRNLGLVTGAAVMGAVFALAAGTGDMHSADPAIVAHGLHVTFGVACGAILAALAIALA